MQWWATRLTPGARIWVLRRKDRVVLFAPVQPLPRIGGGGSGWGRGRTPVKAVPRAMAAPEHADMARNQFMLQRAQQLRTNSTPAERRMWSMLRAKRLAGLKFRRQHLIANYIVNFVCLPPHFVFRPVSATH